MDTVLCLRSAWEYWHAARVTDDPQLRADPVARRKPLSMPRSRATLVPSHAPTAAELLALQRGFERFGALKLADGIHEIPGITNPVHILVATGASRRPIEGCVIHQAHVPLAAGSLVWIENGLMLSSPEHLYLQAAVRLDRLELTWFASELCSVFSLHPDDAGTLAPARPLTTLKKLSDYIMEACKSNPYGCKKALAGLAYAVEGAASRREIACALRMCVPRSWGGRGIPKPVLNYGLTIDKRHAAVHGWRHVSVDIAWPQAQLAMEYDSDAYHLETQLSDKLKVHRPLFREIRNGIYSRHSSKKTVSELAEDASLSVSYFQHIYKELFGVSVIQDIIRSRIERACYLLTVTPDSVAHIAEVCGYENVEHFNRQFKEITGFSPNQYRKKK